MSAKKSNTQKPDNLVQKIMSASLQGWNKYLAAIFAVQGIVILILSVNRSLPVTTSYLGVDRMQTQGQGQQVLATGTQHLFDINIAFLVAAFFLVAVIAHVLQAVWLRSMYEADVKRGINKLRWIEYALCAGIMMLLIGMLVGVQDISTLLMLFGATAGMSLLGLVMEVVNQGARRVNWWSYFVGIMVGALPWLVVAIYLISGGVFGTAAPAFVYWVVGVMLLIFAAFAVNTYFLYQKRGNWKEYAYGERVFMILSLVAKTTLAWLVFAGSLHP